MTNAEARAAMMLPSHLAATLLIGLILGFVWRMDERAWSLAMAFGVAVDLDHVLAIPGYVSMHGPASILDVQATMAWGAHWQGFMHTPWALVVLVPVALHFRSLVPFGFWALHMVLDFVVAARYVEFGSAMEWLVLAGMVAGMLAVLGLQHRLTVPRPGSFGTYLVRRASAGALSILALNGLRDGE